MTLKTSEIIRALRKCGTLPKVEKSSGLKLSPMVSAGIVKGVCAGVQQAFEKAKSPASQQMTVGQLQQLIARETKMFWMRIGGRPNGSQIL